MNKLKIAYLASPLSIHTVRWVNEMAQRGHEIHLLTVHGTGLNPLDSRVIQHKLLFPGLIGYYLNVPIIRNLLHSLKPDVLNVHYASGYGTLARLSHFHPMILSVWGQDVFDFPYKSKWNMTTQKNILQADRVVSISRIMKTQIERLQPLVREVVVVPWGVDCKKFAPQPRLDSNKLRIGTVKSLAPKYGVSYLIKAFAQAKQQGLSDAELILVGSGPQENELKQLVHKLQLQEVVQFIGSVPHAEVPQWLNSFDIYVALSTLDSESFGVAIVEASACGLPVLVSNAGGLPEVVVDGQTGFIVPKKDVQAATEKLIYLATNKDLRHSMGQQGRAFVLANYNWIKNADKMEQLYFQVALEYHQ